MHIGAIIIVIIIIRCLANRSGQGVKPAQSSGSNLVYQDVSFRSVFLVVFYVSLYAVLIFPFYDALERILPPFRITWLRDLLLIAGAGIPPLVLFRAVPPWLAWRVCRPLRIPFLARFFYWFTPGATVRELESFAALLRAARGFEPSPPVAKEDSKKEKMLRFFLLKRKPLPFRIDDWLIASTALAAEVRGDYDRTRRLIRCFDLCPPEMRASGILRRFAFEEMALNAAKRGEWEEVMHRANLGAGRSMPLLKLLATAGQNGRVNRIMLWLAWLISPKRLTSFPFVLDAQKGCAAPHGTSHVQDYPESDSNPRKTHLRLLQRASEGAPVAMEEVFCLARTWDGELTSRSEENLLRRGMELGARDVLGIAGKIRESVLDELGELAAVADGRMPEEVFDDWEEEDPSCVDELLSRLRNRLYDQVSRAQDQFEVESGATLSDEEIQERWEIWLALHDAASRLHRLLGTDELATLWYGGLGNTAWNSASRIFNSTGERTAWIAILMFYWVAEISELLGDEESRETNLNNMKICGYSQPYSLRRFLLRIWSPVRRLRRKLVGSGIRGTSNGSQ